MVLCTNFFMYNFAYLRPFLSIRPKPVFGNKKLFSLTFTYLQQNHFTHTQDNVYKDFDTNWDEKAIRHTKNYICPHRSTAWRIPFTTNFYGIMSMRVWLKIDVIIQDILLPGLQLKTALFCLTLAVHCWKNQ